MIQSTIRQSRNEVCEVQSLPPNCGLVKRFFQLYICLIQNIHEKHDEPKQNRWKTNKHNQVSIVLLGSLSPHCCICVLCFISYRLLLELSSQLGKLITNQLRILPIKRFRLVARIAKKKIKLCLPTKQIYDDWLHFYDLPLTEGSQSS